MNSSAMTPAERRAAASLTSIYALRMLGLFLLFPVLALYASRLEGSTPVLIGLALGAYGLTQAVLQIPFGILSDRFGRKPIIAVGLGLFALGSAVAAASHTLGGVILGRALQGSGAIAGPVMALAADLSREESRTKVMALIGISIGLSFAVALILGPVLNSWIGVPGIFWMIAVLAVAAVAVLKYWVPNPVRSVVHRDAETVPGQLKAVLADSQLLRLDFSILVLHTILTATFVVTPLALRDVAGLSEQRHWEVYLPVLALSVVAMVPFIILAEKKRLIKPVMVGAIFALGAAEFGLRFLYHSVTGIVAMLLLFFTAFNLLEASLPSLMSKLAPPDRKGTALGVYSTSQFLGAFLGGSLGGWLYGHYGFAAVFGAAAAVAAVWLLSTLGMQSPRYLSSYILNVGEVDEAQARQLAARLGALPGVAEAVVIVEEGVAYLKVDRNALNEDALQAFSARGPSVSAA
jgi:MFS family permease